MSCVLGLRQGQRAASGISPLPCSWTVKWGARDAEYSLSGPLDQTHTLSPEILKPS